MTIRRTGEWITHSTLRTVYSNWWVTLRIDDVERPDGSHVEHEVVTGRDSAAMVVLHPDRGILMIWRHRFMPDTWGWEIPGGGIDPAESPEATARREFHEETGWRVTGPAVLLSRHHPSAGFVSQTFHLFLAHDAEYDGAPEDANEAAEIAWRPLPQVAEDLTTNTISDGFSQLAVALALGVTGHGDLLLR